MWHNWRTSETASESASARTRNAQQTWNQKGQDWQRDRPSSSQDWRHDWQWEGDRDRTVKGSSASNTARGSQQAGPDDESWGPGSDWMWHQGDAGRQAAPSGTSPGEPEPIEEPPVVEISSRTPSRQESGPHHNLSERWWRSGACFRPLGRSYTKPTRRAPHTSSNTSSDEEISKNSTPASI